MPSSPFPVPVVRLIIMDGERRALLLQRAAGTYGGGGWCLPGGKIDYGLTVEETIRKELKEETALDLESFRFLFYQDSLPPEDGGMHCLNLYFECSVRGSVQLNHESSAYAWVTGAEAAMHSILFGNGYALRRYWSD